MSNIIISPTPSPYQIRIGPGLSNYILQGSPETVSSEFTYYATNFAGNGNYLSKTTALTSIAADGKGLLSVWVKRDAACSTQGHIFQIGRMKVQFLNPEYGLDAANSAATRTLWMYRTGTPDTSWHHVLMSWDLSVAGRRKIVLDGTESTNQLDFVLSDTIDYSTSGMTHINTVGVNGNAGSDATVFTGDLCELYFTVPSSYYDITDSANVEKFRTTGGKPENLGIDGSTPTGTQPYLYLKNNYASFGTNAGSGGNFTVTGTLTDAATKP